MIYRQAAPLMLSLTLGLCLSVSSYLYIYGILALHLKVALSVLRTKSLEKFWAGVQLILEYLTTVTSWVYI